MSTLSHDLHWLLPNIELQDGKFLLLVLLITSLGGFIYISFLSISSDRYFWNTLPWAGLHTRFFSRTRAGFNAIRQTRGIVEEGYQKVCRQVGRGAIKI
jgi:hypothetical protein